MQTTVHTDRDLRRPVAIVSTKKVVEAIRLGANSRRGSVRVKLENVAAFKVQRMQD